MAVKFEQALAAEEAFLSHLRATGHQLLDEREQRQQIQVAIENDHPTIRLTPDVLFQCPETICGQVCHWMEYKNTFGFKSNPFVHAKHKAQLHRYVKSFGEGMVVYKLGHERARWFKKYADEML
ncbi:hypothetical protein B0A55_07965 [Friedmanniomyces simplex]|uniref:CDAN1-interacting nuclease 1 n=1 Tax=Friedmanniomyces simplex TaxID=329884 RepID=A0A4U0XEP6_9PEZI|nr:hypothetical protein B0A55_07965 [Friedmanniomyces simplex]